MRYVKGLERGRVVRLLGGLGRASRDGPAWALHRLLFDATLPDDAEALATYFVEKTPCHFHWVSPEVYWNIPALDKLAL